MGGTHHIRVGEITYSFLEDDSGLNERHRFGETCHTAQRYSVHTRLEGDRKREILLHEIVHMIEAWWLPEDNLTERQVFALARGLLTVFKDNPEVRKYIWPSHEAWPPEES